MAKKDTDIEVQNEQPSELSSVKTIPQTIWDALRQPTPARAIKKRQGPGGRQFDYVEAGYVKDLLNKTFNTWSFTIVDKQVGKNQIWVQGRLTVQIPVPQQDGTLKFIEIVKEQFGGAIIKKSRETQVPVDIGNDLKAAASDALKKCASEWGVASDIYWGDLEESAEPEREDMSDLVDAKKTDRPTTKQINYMNVLISEKGISRTVAHGWFDVESLNDLTYEQGQQMIKKLMDIKAGGNGEPDPTDLF